MKQMVCEMCGGTDLVKDGGVFVCQTCGCKYSIEEAKKMMVEGTVDVQGTVKIDNTAQIQNYLDLSENAYESGNGQSAFDYANKALEIAPQNSKAWIAKMKAIEYLGTLGELKLMEVYEAGKNAVTYAPEEEKEDTELEVYAYELTRALDLLKLAMNKMADDADIRRTYKTFLAISLLTAGKNTMDADSGVVNLYDNIANEARSLVLLVPDDILARHLPLVHVVEECAKQYQYETDALSKRYSIYGAALTESAKKARDDYKKEIEEKAKSAKDLAEKHEAEKRAKYWAEHADEKKALDDEKSNLQNEIESIKSQLESLQEVIQLKDIQKKIAVKKSEKDSLGLFKGKEKKALQEQIEALQKDESIATTAKENAVKPYNQRLNDIEKRIAEIDEELSKNR